MRILKIYFRSVLKYWWSIAIGAIGGGARLLTEIWPKIMIANWIWISMLVGGFMCAQFFVWRELHEKTEKNLDEENLRQDELATQKRLAGAKERQAHVMEEKHQLHLEEIGAVTRRSYPGTPFKKKGD